MSMQPNIIEEDFVSSWKGWGSHKGAMSASRAGVGGQATSIVPPTATTIENPLFWPFPMQGRPILPHGKMLEEAGFALL